MTLVGSKHFIFGGKIGRTTLNDMWAFDLNSRAITRYCSEPFSSDSPAVKSQPVWESYEPALGNEKPLSRASHVSVATEDRIIMYVPLLIVALPHRDNSS
jgi:Galactose oxidase, central domain